MEQLKPYLVVAAIVAAVLWYLYSSRMRAKRSKLAHEAVKNGAVLLDVRTKEEFASGHLPGAKNIPVQELQRRIRDLGKKKVPVVVYCRSGARSSSARRVLEANGYDQIIDLGPMSAW